MRETAKAYHSETISRVVFADDSHSIAPRGAILSGLCCAHNRQVVTRSAATILSDGGPQARVDVARTSGGTDGVPSLLMERLPPRQQSRTRGSRVRGTLARRSSFFPGSGGAVTRKDAGSARDGRSENTPGASFFLKHRWEAPYQLTGWARLRVAGPSTSAPWWSRGYVLGVGSPLPMDVGPGGIFPDWC